jgi:hypothetical protein
VLYISEDRDVRSTDLQTLDLDFSNSAGADATGANPHCFVGLSNKHPNALKIRIPASARQIMGVTDPVPINRAFVANFTTCHEGNLLIK